jgi:hypothetical protein
VVVVGIVVAGVGIDVVSEFVRGVLLVEVRQAPLVAMVLVGVGFV